MAMGQQFEPQGSDLMVRLLMSPIIPIHWYKLVYTVLSSTQMVTVSFIQLRPDPFVHLSFNFPNKVTPKHGNQLVTACRLGNYIHRVRLTQNPLAPKGLFNMEVVSLSTPERYGFLPQMQFANLKSTISKHDHKTQGIKQTWNPRAASNNRVS